jgi:hypothetical protein
VNDSTSYRPAQPSPTGRYAITFHCHEAFNSCWVDTPSVLDQQTGETLFSFQNMQWSADEAQWLDESTVRFSLRQYPGNHEPRELAATLDLHARQARVGEGAAVPLTDLERSLEASITWFRAEPQPASHPLARLQRALRRLIGR